MNQSNLNGYGVFKAILLHVPNVDEDSNESDRPQIKGEMGPLVAQDANEVREEAVFTIADGDADFIGIEEYRDQRDELRWVVIPLV